MNCTLIKKSCVGLLAIILSTSCADLTENLTGQPTVDKFFQTLTDFNSYITGAYTPLNPFIWYRYALCGQCRCRRCKYPPSSDGKDSNRLTLTQ